MKGSEDVESPESRRSSVDESRLELDRQRFVYEQRIDEQRLELDRAKIQSEKKFGNRHFATIVTGVISLAAVAVSVSQVIVSYVSKQKEIELAQIAESRQRELTSAQQARDWNFKAVEFVAAHQDLIFSSDLLKRDQIAKVMLVAFPPDVTGALFQRLTDSSSDGSSVWLKAQTEATKLLLVRIDGLYMSPPSETRRFLRFYPNGVVMMAVSTGDATPTQAARWLVPGFKYASEGRIESSGATPAGALEIEGAAIKFSVKSADGAVDYEGTVRGDSLRLNFYSHINGNSGNEEYRFVRLDE